eukprot:957872-Prorocentrum_minimum.AAC.2
MAAIADIRSAGTSGVSVMVQRTRNVHIGHVLLFRGFLRDRVLSPRLHGTATDWSWRNIFDDANVHSVVGRVYLAYSVVQNLERETDWWANSSGVVRGWQAPVLLGESEAGHVDPDTWRYYYLNVPRIDGGVQLLLTPTTYEARSDGTEVAKDPDGLVLYARRSRHPTKVRRRAAS